MIAFTHAVRIGPEFFAKAKNDYRDWKWAIAREFMQNCIDAPGCDWISVKVEDVDHDLAPWTTRLTVENNGTPMTREALTDKLLSLGGSGKNCQGTVGGFGKAKEVLYFCHESYEIVTGRLRASGSGAGYDLMELEEDDKIVSPGTRSTVEVADKLAAELGVMFKNFMTMSQWRGTFELEIIPGREPHGTIPTPTKVTLDERLKKGQGRRNLGSDDDNPDGWGRVYTNKDVPDCTKNVVVVRIGGTPMFTRSTSFDGCVILELNGKSLDVLQSSRDALKWTYAAQLDQFCTDLVTNKRSALIDKRPVTERTKYSGYKLKGSPKATPYLDLIKREAAASGTPMLGGTAQIVIGGKGYDPASPEGHVAAALVNLVKVTADPSSQTYAQTGAQRPQALKVPLRPEFMLKNETGMKVPEYYTPDAFSAYSKGLIWRWMGVLVTLADLYGATNPFTVGFIFTEEETLAQYEQVGDQRTIYIRAADVVRHEGKSPVMKARWSLTGGIIWDLVATAAHEFTHYLGYGSHNEDFAAKLTDIMATCLKERTRLAKVFQQRVEWPDTEKDW